MSPPFAPSRSQIHPFYRLLFLYLEPLILLAGAAIAFFLPSTYLSTIHAVPPHSALYPDILPSHPTLRILTAGLANVYALFCLFEACILRATDDVHVWRTFLACALWGDVAHLAIYSGLGVNVEGGGLLGLGMADWAKPMLMIFVRVAFLLGLGSKVEKGDEAGKRAQR
ncbi:hypothetical protein MMC10_011407 [Thelotrema lepadinum]|nr:hypothetical protein [Thelotrema lepadinum]